MYLSAVLKKGGHSTKLGIIGGDMDLGQVVADYKPDVLAASVMTGSHIEFMKLASELKKRHKFMTMMGGSHPTFHPEVLSEFEDADFVVQGEAEEAVLELANALQNGTDTTQIKNIWTKKDGKIYKTEMRNLAQDIDTVPFPDRELVYEHPLWLKQPIRHFIACRGCAYRCTYCFNNAIAEVYKGKGMWVRWRAVDKVVAEVKEVLQKYGGKFVYFQDDIFIMDKKWLEEFAEKYSKEIGLPFHCHVRPNLVDEASAKLLKKAGCYSVHAALETADDELRKLIERDMSKDVILNACKYLNDNGIKIMLQNILGLPTSTLKNDYETLELNIACKPLYAWCSLFQPYPGLELTEYARQKGLLDENKEIGRKFFEASILKISEKQEREHLRNGLPWLRRYPMLY